MRGFASAAALLPPDLRRSALALPEEDKTACEELRLRRGWRPTALLAGREYALRGTGPVTETDIRAVLEAATGASLHAAGEQLARGFVAAPGGVRVGVCGTAAGPASGAGLRCFSSLAVRVPRAVPGCADGIWDTLAAGGFASTVLISPPGGGKTTLLRELVRRLSLEGRRVAVADERGEIADAWTGEPGFDVGPCADVLTGFPKAEAAAMLLRAMGPQVLAMDEIAGDGDERALREAAGCGVVLLATAHGDRQGGGGALCRRLWESGLFRRRVWIDHRAGRRCYRVEKLPCA